jgi:hypothetical protein
MLVSRMPRLGRNDRPQSTRRHGRTNSASWRRRRRLTARTHSLAFGFSFRVGHSPLGSCGRSGEVKLSHCWPRSGFIFTFSAPYGLPLPPLELSIKAGKSASPLACPTINPISRSGWRSSVFGSRRPGTETRQLVPRGSRAPRGCNELTVAPGFQQGGLPGTGECEVSSSPSKGPPKLEQDECSPVNPPEPRNTSINNRLRETLPCQINATTTPPPSSRPRARDLPAPRPRSAAASPCRPSAPG